MSAAAGSRTSTPLRDPAVAARLVAPVAAAIAGSAFQSRHRWPHAVVILRREEKRVTSRADLAQWLRANDLRDQAQECMSRTVSRGCILVWLEVDDPNIAVAGFLVFDLAAAVHASRTSP